MLRPRITPCLLIHNGGLVKTVRFDEPKYVGDPLNAVKIFNEKEADELVVLDIDASVRGVEPDFHLIASLAAECRMPLCYGGGIKTPDQARRIIGLGVEKIAISSVAVEDPSIITSIAAEVGRQSVVVVIDVRRRGDDYEVWTHNGQRPANVTLADSLREAGTRGAGEIVVNSIDQDGMMKGYDLELATRVREMTALPITMLGGAGSLDDIGRLVEKCGVLGAASGSLFVFKGIYRAVLINYPRQSAKEELIRRCLPPTAGHQ
ncbi:MAG: AglZ/HisF2 family acetamidino modification protein [Gemmatimonadales bacterium]|nr:AglZ/HisF2 family acetamidino modification protein [Gemmatimonadales bacterium]